MKLFLISTLFTFMGINAKNMKCENCCEIPKIFQNGKIYFREDLKRDDGMVPEDTLLKFRCKHRFELLGIKQSICIGGRWIPRIPVCIEKICPLPPQTEHGEILLTQSTFKEGDRAIYKCKTGYEVIDRRSSLLCKSIDDRLAWSGELPKCVEKPKCDDPGTIWHGYRSGECCHEGSILHYDCLNNFLLVGNRSMECLKGNVWSNTKPTCRPKIFCPEPLSIPNGEIKVLTKKSSDYYVPFDEVIVKCDEDYSVDKAVDVVYCQEDGKWDSEFPKCTATRSCKKPHPPLNGFIHELQATNQSTFPIGSEINFGCDEGYRVIGNRWNLCDGFGWARLFPECREIECEDFDTPEHGWKYENGFSIESYIKVGCLTGYNLLGSPHRECLPNGKWSGELARCKSDENDCVNPGTPIGGVKIGNSYDFGNFVKFFCKNEKFLIGSQTRMCRQNGEWSGEEATCIGENDFDDKKNVLSNLKTFLDNSSKVPLVLYFVIDASRSVGRRSFKESIGFAKAIVKSITVNKDGTRIGAIIFSYGAEKAFSPMDYTTTEEVLKALDNIDYPMEGATFRSPFNLLKREFPVELTFLTKDSSQKPVIFVLSDGKADLHEDIILDAEELKDNGVEIYCVGITGDRRLKSLYNIATSSKEEHVFILDNYDSMNWLAKEISGIVDYSQCGIKERKPGNDQRVLATPTEEMKHSWPWMAAFHVKGHFERYPSKYMHHCGSTLLNEYWIMTAAHCLYIRETKKKINKEDIIIYLNISSFVNQNNHQEYKIENILMHPQYNYENLRYNYDIALLKLSRPVEFNEFVRPICLPPNEKEFPQETLLYKVQERAVAIGWKYDMKLIEDTSKPLPPIKELFEVDVPLQNRSVCSESLSKHSYKFTDMMICAGSGQGGNDTCGGDSGGPLQQKLKNELQKEYWVQIGIISWGIGCGLRGQYAYYTNIAKFVDWIRENID